MIHCWNCGAENEDDAAWCGRCGVSLDPQARDSVDSESGWRPVQRVEPVPVQRASHVRTRNLQVAPDSPTMRPVELNTKPASRRGGGRYVAVAFAIIAALIVIGWGLHAYNGAMQNASSAAAANDEAHRAQTVTVTFDAPGYMEGSSSSIPVHVTGSDLDGNSVDEKHLMSTYNNKLDLKRGTYTLEVAGSPVTAGGMFFDITQGKATIVISEDGISVVGSSADSPTFTLAQAAMENVTDDQINATRQWMQDYGMDDSTVTRFINALTSARDERVKEVAAEQQAAQEEAEKTAQEAAAEDDEDEDSSSSSSAKSSRSSSDGDEEASSSSKSKKSRSAASDDDDEDSSSSSKSSSSSSSSKSKSSSSSSSSGSGKSSSGSSRSSD